MSRYQEDKSQHCPIRVFQPKPGQPTTIINPNNKLRTDIPECEGTDGALFYAVDKLGRCTGNRGTLTSTGGANANQYTVGNAWRDATKIVPGPNNKAWTDILDSYNNQNRANLFAAAGELVVQLSGQEHLGDTAVEMWKNLKFRKGQLNKKTPAEILTAAEFWNDHIWPNLPFAGDAVNRTKALTLALDVFGVEVHDYLDNKAGFDEYTTGNNPNPAGGGPAALWTFKELAALVQKKVARMDRDGDTFTFGAETSQAQGKRKREDNHDARGNQQGRGHGHQGRGGGGRHHQRGRGNQRGQYGRSASQSGRRNGNNGAGTNRDICTDPHCNRDGRVPNHTNQECHIQRRRREGTWHDNRSNQRGRGQHQNQSNNRQGRGGGGRNNRYNGGHNNNRFQYNNQDQRPGQQNNGNGGQDNFVADIVGAVVQGFQGQQNRQVPFRVPSENYANDAPPSQYGRDPYMPPPGYSHPGYGGRRY